MLGLVDWDAFDILVHPKRFSILEKTLDTKILPHQPLETMPSWSKVNKLVNQMCFVLWYQIG